MLQLSQEKYDVNRVFHSLFDFFLEIYKVTSVLSQKLIEIEIMDLSKKNSLNFFNEVNSYPNFFESDIHILANDSLPTILKIRETQFITDLRQLQEHISHNDNILAKMIKILNNLQGFQLYYLEVKDKRVNLFEIRLSQNEKEVRFDLKSSWKILFYGFSLFLIPFQLPKNYDFKNSIDFFKIWGIYNGSINIIAKYLSSKTIKELFKNSKSLENEHLTNSPNSFENSASYQNIFDMNCFSNINELEFERKMKIFNVCYIFSFYDEKDIDLIDLFQNLDHRNFLFTNERQYFTELNKKEIIENFRLTFSIEENNYEFLSKSIKIDQLNLKMEIILGITEKIKGRLFCFKFKNKKLIFNNYDNPKGNFLNLILKESLHKFPWNEFGLQTDISKEENEFMIVGSLNSIKTRKVKIANFSIILVVQFEKIEMDCIDNMNSMRNFLVFEVQKFFFFIFENLRKKNGFNVLISKQENKLKCILNENIPKICSSILKINEMIQGSPIDIHHLKKKLLNNILFKSN